MSSLLRPAHGAAPAQVVELGSPDREAVLELLDRDPIVNAVLTSRVRALHTLDRRRIGGELLGIRDGGGWLRAAVFVGGNLLPVGGDAGSWDALGRHLVRRPRPCSSFVGRSDAIRRIWAHLAQVWGPARAVRERQHLLALDAGSAAVNRLPGGDARLHVAGIDELDAYFPAAVAMFTEELGASPLAGTGAEYRVRVAGLLRERRALTITDTQGVLFKADIGAVTPQTCQVQGVWVRPDVRGRGVGTAAMAGVLRHALTLAPTASLYVNDFNTAAVRMYTTLGMSEIANLSTILF